MKKTIIATLMALMCAVTFAQNAASDFTIDAAGVITKYNGWDAAVVIPETVNGIRVTAIGNNAFSSNDLTSVTIPRGVISIGREAFRNNKLNRVTIPDSVTSIGNRAFQNNQLASVTIPGNDVTIDGYAFDNNPITSVTLGRNHLFNMNIVPEIMVGNRRTSNSLYFDYMCNDRNAGTYTTNRGMATSKTEADFEYVETQYGAFIIGYRGSSGNRLEIPSRLGNLPVKAIRQLNNKGISRVRIPDSVTSIDERAFGGNRLTEITIPNGVTYIGARAFEDNQLTEITIPNGVTTIGARAFAGNQLTSIIIGNSVTYIGAEAFAGNKLTSVTIPDSVTYIGGRFGEYSNAGAFGDNQLTSVTIGSNVTSIASYAFSNNPLTSVTIGNNVTIASSSFPSGFADAYNANGKAAGTYTRSDANSNNWTKQ